MSDFFAGVRPVELIPGDPAGVRELAARLRTLSSGLGDVASEVGRIDATGWKGQAADAFRAVVHQQPDRYSQAGTGFLTASDGLQAYAHALENAQQDAGRAIATWEDAQAASAAWQQRQADAASTAARAHAHPELKIQVPTVSSTDPGDAGRGQAESILSGARANLDAAANQVKAVLSDAKQHAPHKPGLFSRIVHGVESLGKDALDAQHWLVSRIEHGAIDGVTAIGRLALDGLKEDAHLLDAGAKAVGIDPAGWARSYWNALPSWERHFYSGAWEGTVGMGAGLVTLGKLGWSISPTRMMLDPEGWAKSELHFGEGVYRVGRAAVGKHRAQFWKGFASNLVDAHEWRTDPAKAIGRFVPLVVVAVATGGAGGAAGEAASDAGLFASGATEAEGWGYGNAAAALREFAEEDASKARTLNAARDAARHLARALDVEGGANAADGETEPDHVLDGQPVDYGGEKAGERIGRFVVELP